MGKERTADGARPKVSVKEGPPPALGEAVFEREIPSDAALVTPLVVRLVEFLRKESLILAKDENKIGLCLEEALQNAIDHGNKKDFQKKVLLSVFLREDEWLVVISDQGTGFDPAMVRDPLQGDSLWGESGRGLYLMSHYMDRMEFYDRGRTILLARKL